MSKTKDINLFRFDSMITASITILCLCIVHTYAQHGYASAIPPSYQHPPPPVPGDNLYDAHNAVRNIQGQPVHGGYAHPYQEHGSEYPQQQPPHPHYQPQQPTPIPGNPHHRVHGNQQGVYQPGYYPQQLHPYNSANGSINPQQQQQPHLSQAVPPHHQRIPSGININHELSSPHLATAGGLNNINKPFNGSQPSLMNNNTHHTTDPQQGDSNNSPIVTILFVITALVGVYLFISVVFYSLRKHQQQYQKKSDDSTSSELLLKNNASRTISAGYYYIQYLKHWAQLTWHMKRFPPRSDVHLALQKTGVIPKGAITPMTYYHRTL